jgi:hypothetical protein
MLLAPVLVALQLVAANGAANQVPTLDVGPGCRAAVDVSGISTPEQSCLNDEQAARNDLAKEWSQFPASDKTLCLDQTKDYNPSYVELQTCLELLRDARIPYKPSEPPPGLSSSDGP